ncbi:hypothetical protein Tco_0257737 [Tanacetum coccineum]
MGDVDINTPTMEKYLALTRGNQAPSVVKPEIGGNVKFEIKSQFMRQLREGTFSGNKNNNAYEHVEGILDIVSLFNILGVTHDAVMLHVFPITLTGAAKRWVDRLPPRMINTWDLLKKAFIQRYCPPSEMTKQLEEIHNFKQEGDETLYQAWERYNDLLYKCLTHDLNTHKKINIFYKGLDTTTRQLLDSPGPIPDKMPTQTFDAIQTMTGHSHKWHDRSTRRCETCGGAHLDKECLLREEVKSIEEVKSTGILHTCRYHPPFGEKKPSLEELMNKHLDESTRKRAKMEEWMKKLHESTKVKADDLKKLKDYMQVKLKGTSSSLKSKDRYAYHKLKDKDSRRRAKTEDIRRMLSLRFLKKDVTSLRGRLLGIEKRLGHS